MQIYLVRVIEEPEVSRHLAVTLGVPHESPQLIVLRNGSVVWSASHSGITYQALEKVLGSLEP